MLQWSESFETGHALIDNQHKRLITYINRLEGITQTTNPNREQAEFILRLVDFMETYIDEHFNYEEKCMDSYRCPAHQENKEAHEKFLRFFRQFKLRFETEGFRPEVLKELHETCNTWIEQHILQIDMQLKPCIHQTANPDKLE